MGVAWSQVRRTVGNYNIERRAEKVLQKAAEGKHIVAPRHVTEKHYIDEALKNEELKKLVDSKNLQLLEWLKNVTVTSTEPELQVKDPYVRNARQLPTKEGEYQSHLYVEPEFGFQEVDPEKVSPGKLTFREALALMNAKLPEPLEVNANRYSDLASTDTSFAVKRVDPKKIERMHRYFAPFQRIGTGKFTKKDTHLLEMEKDVNFREEYEKEMEMKAFLALKDMQGEQARKERQALIEAEEIKMKLKAERQRAEALQPEKLKLERKETREQSAKSDTSKT